MYLRAYAPSTVRHYVFGFLMIVLVIAISVTLISIEPFLGKSLLSLVFGGSGSGSSGGISRWIYAIIVGLLVMILLRPGAIKKYARREEEIYRSGAQYQTWSWRVFSCIRFGFVHIFNLIVPFGVVIALMAGGAYFMTVYMSTYNKTFNQEIATRESTRAHVAYNKIALTLILSVIILKIVTG